MTDPLDPTSTIPPGDFFVVLPYLGEHALRTLRFATNVSVADVFFLVDMTGSMGDERTNLIRGLIDVIIPGVRAAIRDVQFGAGGFDDYPVERLRRRAATCRSTCCARSRRRSEDLGAWSIARGADATLPVAAPRRTTSGRSPARRTAAGTSSRRSRACRATAAATGPSRTCRRSGRPRPGWGCVAGRERAGPHVPGAPRRGGRAARLPVLPPGRAADRAALRRRAVPQRARRQQRATTDLLAPPSYDGHGRGAARSARASSASTPGGDRAPARASTTRRSRATPARCARTARRSCSTSPGRLGPRRDRRRRGRLARRRHAAGRRHAHRRTSRATRTSFDATQLHQVHHADRGLRRRAQRPVPGITYRARTRRRSTRSCRAPTSTSTSTSGTTSGRPPRLAQIFRARIIVVGNGVADLDARNVYIVVPPDGGTILI